MKFQCTECDTVYDTFVRAAQCHKGIGGVIELDLLAQIQEAGARPLPQTGDEHMTEPWTTEQAVRELGKSIRERHDEAWSVTMTRPSEQPVIVVTGNPVDGFGFLGPFVNAEEAVAWTEHVDLEPDWWVANLSPADFDDEGER